MTTKHKFIHNPFIVTIILSSLIFITLSIFVHSIQTLNNKDKSTNRYFVSPNSLLYPYKRIYEKYKLTILSGERKYEYQSKLIDRRLDELLYVVENNKTGFYSEAIGRYNSQISDNTYILNSNKNDAYQKNIDILIKLRDRYPSNSPYWLQIQEAIDTTELIINQ